MKKPEKKETIVEKYNRTHIAMHWLILITVILLLITSGPPFYNWFMLEMNVHNVQISELPYSLTLHWIIGIIFTLLVIYYFIMLTGDKERELFTKNLATDVNSYRQSVKLMLSFSRKREVGEGEKYLRSQRVLFFLFIYTIGLMIISGISLLLPILISQTEFEPSMENFIFITHILSLVMFMVLSIILIGPIIRRTDKVALKSILVNGKVPVWYLKKYHKVWYKKIGKNHTDMETK